MAGLVKEFEKPNHAQRSRVVNGIFHLMTIVVKNHFGGDEKKFEPCDPNGIVLNTLQGGIRGISLSAHLGHNFEISPDVVGQHDHLEECKVMTSGIAGGLHKAL